MKKNRRILIGILIFLSISVSLLWGEEPQIAEFNSSIWDNTTGFTAGSHVRYPMQVPSYLLINPAIYNPLNVPILELGYGGLIDLNEANYGGHRASLWTNIPIISGQINAGLEFQHLATSGVATGTQARLHAAWSNKVFEQFLLGFGLEGGFSLNGEKNDWALSAKVGISQNFAALGPFDELTWYAALTNIGKEMSPNGTESTLYYRSPFTLRGGVSASIDFIDEFQLYSAIHLGLPSFTDLLLNLQLSLVFFKRLSLSIAWGFDLRQQIEKSYKNASLLPRVSLSFSLFQEEFPDLDATVSVYSPYENHLAFAAGAMIPLDRVDREGPIIDITAPQTIYISPDNNGVQDDWSEAISVSDKSSLSRMDLRILTDNNEEVFKQTWDIEPVLEEGIYGFIQEVFQTNQTVVIPESVYIFGKDNTGNFLPDDRYTIEISIVDILGNTSTRDNIELVIDTQKPEIIIEDYSPEEIIFSPNEDGNKDTLTLTQEGSIEDLWSMEIYDTFGNLVWERSIQNTAPQDFHWDGSDISGLRLPDGVYQYKIFSTDRAGNENSQTVQNIIINSLVSPVKISLADSYFSPNGDGIKDELGFLPILESRTGVASWTIEILDVNEEKIAEISGTGTPPSTYSFDGSTGSDILSEGMYRSRFIVEYFSGNRPQALSPWFTLDISKPKISVSTFPLVISPNNDARSDELLIRQEFESSLEWEAEIINSRTGEVIYTLPNNVPLRNLEIWNGRSSGGQIADDDSYAYILRAVDRAGNFREVRSSNFILDTSEAEVLANANFIAFSPNDDGSRDNQVFSFRVSNNDEVQRYAISIHDTQNRIVDQIEGNTAVPENITWNGKDSNGNSFPDGEYFARLEVELRNRSIGMGRTQDFLIDTVYPSLQVGATYTVFSPNGDNKRDTLPIVQSSQGASTHVATIYSERGEIIRDYYWEDTIRSFEWNGRDKFNNLVPNGSYRYSVQAEDLAGNFREQEIENIVLDSRSASIFIILGDTGFSPNNDGFKDWLDISLRTSLIDGIDSWSLEIRNESHEIIRMYTGNRNLNSETIIQYDGKDEKGIVQEGNFYARFNVYYQRGDTPEAQSSVFTVDRTGPSISITPSQFLPFSPDGDGIADVLPISLSLDDMSAIKNWDLSIFDRENNLFWEKRSTNDDLLSNNFSREFNWDGLSLQGERVISAEDYIFRARASDVLGNETQIEGIIPIDILVICNRNKTQCKIQIANINFEPNSPVLSFGSSETGQRNREIMSRLVEIFSKYPQYRVTIEGHANSITGTAQEEVASLQPLSLARAESVRTELVRRGMNSESFSIIGRGGSDPIVSLSNPEWLKFSWKNRRVEFILNKGSSQNP